MVQKRLEHRQIFISGNERPIRNYVFIKADCCKPNIENKPR